MLDGWTLAQTREKFNLRGRHGVQVPRMYRLEQEIETLKNEIEKLKSQ